MGVLGWTPAVVMRDASLRDLGDAWQGHARWHGIDPAAPPSNAFLQQMLRWFPDRSE
ncbi:MAG TPA: hypothetical protein VEF76_01080 [Patescibacteria group bacterium]|nr:hypothetical protein [Patescibacteria group bacterium]